MYKKAQVNVVYMSFFVLLGLVFLGFVFTFSNDFKQEGADEMSKYLAESIFARIEKNAIELRAIQNQTGVTIVTKTIGIPRRMGDTTYQIIGKNSEIILQAAGQNAVYETTTIYWDGISFEGSVNSQNAEVNLMYNSTSNKIRIS
jgi:hypothetical protein